MRHRTRTWIGRAVVAALIAVTPAAYAANDTARFYGTWETEIAYNGQTVTLVSTHDASGYRNYLRLPTGNTPAGNGAFSAANGKYTAAADKPNDSGTYRFVNDDAVVCTNAAGQQATWRRAKASVAQAPAVKVSKAPAAATPAATAPDPSLPADTKAGIAAFDRKDYNTAWRDFMAAAQKGDSEAEAGLGAMLFNHLNPPGTGYYAQCEKWLLASANQGNIKGMDFLGQYYYASGVAIAGGINPGINNAPIPPALRQQAEGKFALARQWFERAAAKGDIYAMGNLGPMLDAGIGGPRDPARAAQLRAEVKAGPNADFAKRATADPGNLATSAAWQSGHYADAIQRAQASAAKSDANAQALLGRAYYEGVGVTRNYATALVWVNKAVAQNNPDGLFFLGLMTEHGQGVPQDLDRAVQLFDRAAALGQRYAQMEAKGMRLQGEANRQAARMHANVGFENTACSAAGGVGSGGYCYRGAESIDPYSSTEFH